MNDKYAVWPQMILARTTKINHGRVFVFAVGKIMLWMGWDTIGEIIQTKHILNNVIVKYDIEFINRSNYLNGNISCNINMCVWQTLPTEFDHIFWTKFKSFHCRNFQPQKWHVRNVAYALGNLVRVESVNNYTEF